MRQQREFGTSLVNPLTTACVCVCVYRLYRRACEIKCNNFGLTRKTLFIQMDLCVYVHHVPNRNVRFIHRFNLIFPVLFVPNTIAWLRVCHEKAIARSHAFHSFGGPVLTCVN